MPCSRAVVAILLVILAGFLVKRWPATAEEAFQNVALTLWCRIPSRMRCEQEDEFVDYMSLLPFGLNVSLSVGGKSTTKGPASVFTYCTASPPLVRSQ